MPTGLPLPSSLNSRRVCAFSLDTSIIEAAGFRFTDGPLRHLSGQLPPWLQLWMPDIVLREVSDHRIENVARGVQQVQSGLTDLNRYIGNTFDGSPPEWLLSVRNQATHLFDSQLQGFLQSHNGIVLEPTHERLCTELFQRYFENLPPFGSGRDKKHEFPDAAALLTLEYFAAAKGCQVILVSKDLGWKAFAERSAHLFCVSTIPDLASLFVSRTPEAIHLLRRLEEMLMLPSIVFKANIKTALDSGLLGVAWNIQLPYSRRYRFDTDVVEARLNAFELPIDAIGVWITSPNNDACVVETTVEVDTSLLVQLFAYEFDEFGSKVDAMNAQTIVNQRFEIKLQIEMSGDIKNDSIDNLVVNICLGDSPINVQISRESLGPDWIGSPIKPTPWSPFFEDDDDLPF
jgi:PIN domain